MNTNNRLCDLSNDIDIWSARYPVEPDVLNARMELSKPLEQCTLEVQKEYISFIEAQNAANREFIQNSLKPHSEELHSYVNEMEILSERRKSEIRKRNQPLILFIYLGKAFDFMSKMSSDTYQRSKMIVLKALVILNLKRQHMWAYISPNSHFKPIIYSLTVFGLFTSAYFYFSNHNLWAYRQAKTQPC